MKNLYAVTVSDLNGSRHFTVSKSIKLYFWVALIAVLAITLTSFGINYSQHKSLGVLNDENAELDHQLAQSTALNKELDVEINNKVDLISKISQELIEIEKVSGVDVGDKPLSLEERIRLVSEFYTEKEETYIEIGSRVQQIEGMIGLDKASDRIPHQAEVDLGRRVELASLNASQTRILHDSIPNGFPTDTHVITSRYGNRIHPISKVKSFHKGVDIRAKNKNPVFTTADGIVKSADYSELSGNRIVVQHNFGFETRYSHLHKMHLSAGEIVHRGDLLGQAGNTGRSDAPHLHYEIRYLGKAIDPIDFLKWEFGSDSIFTQVRGVKWPSLISLISKQITHQTLQLSQLDPNLVEP